MIRTRFSSRPGGRTSPLTARTSLGITDGIAGQADWQAQGLCRYADPKIFHPVRGESAEPAKTICGRCPVTDECKQWALDNDEQFGVWGGLSAKQRRKMKPKTERRSAKTAEIIKSGQRECLRCAVTKRLDDFPKDAKSPTGHRGTCKSCRAVSKGQWRRRRNAA